MAGTGDDDERAAGSVVMVQHPVAGVGRYVEEVSRRLRDLPRDEREAIETDLAQHVRDAGCATYSQCIERLGPPRAYADGLRDGLGLGPYPGPIERRRGPLVAAALVVVVVVAAVVGWRATRDDPLGPDFSPIHGPMMSVVEGTASDSFGNGIQLVVDGGGDARFGMVLRNVSDRTLDVAVLGPSYTEWRPDGSAIIGGSGPFGQRAPGAVVLSDLWAPEVRIARLDDPQTISIDAHTATGEPFAPFRWEPGEAYVISIAGDVAPCSGDLAWLDGQQAAILIDFSVGDHGFGQSLGAIGLDTEACD